MQKSDLMLIWRVREAHIRTITTYARPTLEQCSICRWAVLVSRITVADVGVLERIVAYG